MTHDTTINTQVPVNRTITKIPTGILGLDDILEGGFPESRTTIISGGPGCGKSVMGLEFLYRKALKGIPGIYVAFEERADAIRQNALTLGWNLEQLEKNGTFFILEAFLSPKIIFSGEFNILGLIQIIEGKAKQMGCNCIVLDAVDVLLRYYDNPQNEQNEMYAFHHWLIEHQITALMTGKIFQDKDLPVRYEFLDFMADCVIHLDQRVTNQISTRRLKVIKYRGSGFGRNEFPFIISDSGCSIIPISTSGLRYQSLGHQISSGNTILDSILGGGYRQGASILISGITGAGKTTLASTFISHSCTIQERVLFIGFEESQEAILNNMLSPGIDLHPAVKKGLLRFITAIPESMGVEDHLFRVYRHLSQMKPHHIVVDAISACRRMGSDKAAFDYMVRLLHLCKINHITCILINQSMDSDGVHQLSGMEISSLIDTALIMKMIDSDGEVNRMILVLKSRGQCHSNQYREYQITNRGIEFKDIFTGEGGLVSGSSRQKIEAQQEMNKRLRKYRIQQKKNMLANKEQMMKAFISSSQSDIFLLETELKSLNLEEELIQKKIKIQARMRGSIEVI